MSAAPGWDAVLAFGLQHKDCGAGVPPQRWDGPRVETVCFGCGATLDADIRADDSWVRYQELIGIVAKICAGRSVAEARRTDDRLRVLLDGEARRVRALVDEAS